MYILTFLILAFSSWLSISRKLTPIAEKKLYIFLLIWLVLHDGLRWAVGTDWNSYLFEFQDSYFRNKYGMEIGYYSFNKIIRFFSSSYTIFLLINYLFVYNTFGRCFKKYSPYPILSLWLYYSGLIIYMGMNRQLLAMSILMYSIPFVVERKFSPFLIIVTIAISIHYASAIFLLAYFVPQIKNKNYYLLAIFVACFISISGIINRFPLELFYFMGSVIGAKADMYSNNAMSTSLTTVLLGIVKRLIWLILILTSRHKIKESRTLSLMFNLYFVSVLIYILFNGTIFQILVQRGMLYLSIFEYILLAYAIPEIKNYKGILILFFCVYGLWQMNRGMDAFKKDVGYDIFRPYNAVYMDPNKTTQERWDEDLW